MFCFLTRAPTVVEIAEDAEEGCPHNSLPLFHTHMKSADMQHWAAMGHSSVPLPTFFSTAVPREKISTKCLPLPDAQQGKKEAVASIDIAVA